MLERKRNPSWAASRKDQENDLKSKISKKYEKKGISGIVDKGVDKLKGMVGMETNEDRIGVS